MSAWSLVKGLGMKALTVGGTAIAAGAGTLAAVAGGYFGPDSWLGRGLVNAQNAVKNPDAITDIDNVFTRLGRILQNLVKFFTNFGDIANGRANLLSMFSGTSQTPPTAGGATPPAGGGPDLSTIALGAGAAGLTGAGTLYTARRILGGGNGTPPTPPVGSLTPPSDGPTGGSSGGAAASSRGSVPETGTPRTGTGGATAGDAARTAMREAAEETARPGIASRIVGAVTSRFRKVAAIGTTAAGAGGLVAYAAANEAEAAAPPESVGAPVPQAAAPTATSIAEEPTTVLGMAREAASTVAEVGHNVAVSAGNHLREMFSEATDPNNYTVGNAANLALSAGHGAAHGVGLVASFAYANTVGFLTGETTAQVHSQHVGRLIDHAMERTVGLPDLSGAWSRSVNTVASLAAPASAASRVASGVSTVLDLGRRVRAAVGLGAQMAAPTAP